MTQNTGDGARRPKKKLIEVALPLEAINRASGSEKLIHVGTTSNLHAWWARRPLAACRAVVFASLVDDPGEHLPKDEADAERERLFKLIERLVTWDANDDTAVLDAAREEIVRSSNGATPTVVDPFCGSGSIPIEALRLGVDAVGYDLNPIAVAISKALVEVPRIASGHPPVGATESRLLPQTEGFDGFRADLDHYARLVARKASPQVTGNYANTYSGNVTPIAWLWSRTAQCPNPGCNTRIPLLSSLWLSKTKKSRAFLRLQPRDMITGRVGVDVVTSASAEPTTPPMASAGATCPTCNTPVPFAELRAQGRAGKLGVQLNAYVTKSGSNMLFHEATAAHEAAALAVHPLHAPETGLPEAALGFRVQAYGLTGHRDLFLPRQLATLECFSTALEDVIGQVRIDAGDDREYANAVALYLALFFDRLVQTNNTLVRWFVHAARPSKAQPTFDKQTVQMVWDFAETNPLSDSTGGWETCCKYPQTALNCLPRRPAMGRVLHGDSAELRLDRATYVFATDPPYFDNIGYADLSDFFYIWLRRVLIGIYPEIFRTILVPKEQEIISDPSRHKGDRAAAREFFYRRLGRVFHAMRCAASGDYPATIFYAFKQEETSASGAAVSTGWERMLEALIDAGWSVTGTWPMRTEHANRPRGIESNALASSIVLVCRPRADDAQTTSRRDFIAALKSDLPRALAHLQAGNIAPVDLAQAAIGPGMAVYTRYERVLGTDGQPMPMREALALINQTLDEALAEQEGDFDADSRWALAWFEEYAFAEGEYGRAETLSTAKNTSVGGLAQAGILLSKGGKVRLLRPEELPADWDPATDSRLTAWEIVHHLIRVLGDGGESGAAELVAKLNGRAESARELAYRLYSICERKKRAQEALSYNALVQSWPEIARLAKEPARAPSRQAKLFGEED